MQLPTFVRVPTLSVAVVSLPPMHTWPVSLKRAILGLCVFLCVCAYVAMAVGLVGLATLALGLL